MMWRRVRIAHLNLMTYFVSLLSLKPWIMTWPDLIVSLDFYLSSWLYHHWSDSTIWALLSAFSLFLSCFVPLVFSVRSILQIPDAQWLPEYVKSAGSSWAVNLTAKLLGTYWGEAVGGWQGCLPFGTCEHFSFIPLCQDAALSLLFSRPISRSEAAVPLWMGGVGWYLESPIAC